MLVSYVNMKSSKMHVSYKEEDRKIEFQTMNKFLYFNIL